MKSVLSNRFTGILLLTVLAIFAGAAIAQPSVDVTFEASLTKAPEGDVRGIFVQPDGKIFVTGAFTVVNGKVRSSVVKLNADGSLDTSFAGPDFVGVPVARIFKLELQSTGKIIVGGEFVEADGQTKYRLVRLNPNGSLDNTFAAQPLTWVVRDLLVLPDDKIVIGGGFQYQDPAGARNRLVRLNADGTLDTSISFTPEPDAGVSQIIRQADGRLVVAYGNKVVRYTTNGSLDLTFGPINCDNPVVSLKQQADGKILVGGHFSMVNGFSLPKLFRISADGAIDSSFSGAAPNGDVLAIGLAPDQRISIGGSFTLYGGVTRRRAAVLDTNGNLIAAFNPVPNPMSLVYAVAFQPDGKVLIGGLGDPFATPPPPILIRYNTDGSIDESFNPLLGSGGIGARLRIQPADGKILAVGQFTNSNVVNRRSITRFNSDGSLDTGFIPNQDFIDRSVVLTGLDLETDGKIVTVGSAPGNGSGTTLLRLQPDGAFIRTFIPQTRPNDIKVLPSGLILIGSSGLLRRVRGDGTIDTTFNTTVSGTVYRIELQPDEKILIGGDFAQVNGMNRSGIARLNPDGTLDTTFNPFGGTTGGRVADIALQPDGKVIIAGEFTGVNFDTNRKYLARLNSDGSLDTSFAPAVNAAVYALQLQSDGRLLIGGDFTMVNGASRNRFARLNSNGTLEPIFNVSVNDTVLDIVLQADGKIVYVGEFTRTNGVSTIGIGRLLNPSVPLRTPFDFDGDGRADISVFRSSTNRWYEVFSSTGGVVEETFGTAGDILAPADFDGDGKTDEAIFRPSNGQWWYKGSLDGSQIASQFGQAGDVARPSDFDGDGKADLVVFRPSNNTWYRFGSLSGAVPSQVFGVSGDQPLVGDWDGDGRSDLAIFRPSSGDWWYAASGAGGAFRMVHWGQNGDIPVPADYDGDGKTDYAVFRPSDGGWYIYNSGDGSFTILAFGTNGDRPVAADYDGDGRADVAVFRPSTGIWYLNRTTSGFAGYQFGISTDTAVPGSLIP